jgi:hypothetical protein
VIDISEGRRFLTAVSKRPWDHPRIIAAGEQGSGGWPCDKDRRILLWAINKLPELLDEIASLRQQVLNAKVKTGEVFNYQTRLQILTILAKDAIEKKTPEAEERLLKAIYRHQEILEGE